MNKFISFFVASYMFTNISYATQPNNDNISGFYTRTAVAPITGFVTTVGTLIGDADGNFILFGATGLDPTSGLIATDFQYTGSVRKDGEGKAFYSHEPYTPNSLGNSVVDKVKVSITIIPGVSVTFTDEESGFTVTMDYYSPPMGQSDLTLAQQAWLSSQQTPIHFVMELHLLQAIFQN